MPALPLSREVEKLRLLKRSLAAYRLVFGQPRQEDLIAFLQSRKDIDGIDLAGWRSTFAAARLLHLLELAVETVLSSTATGAQGRPGARRTAGRSSADVPARPGPCADRPDRHRDHYGLGQGRTVLLNEN